MKKLLIGAIVIAIVHLNAIAQDKELTLEESVMGQYGSLRPKMPKNIQWIPNSTSFTYLNESGENQEIVLVNAKNLKEKKLISLNELQEIYKNNSIEKWEIKKFPSMEWRNENEVMLKIEDLFVLLDLKQKKIVPITHQNPEIKSWEWNNNKDKWAYSTGSDLYWGNKENTEKVNEFDLAVGVEYGLAVHRYEFGVNKGIFWSENGEKFAYYINNQSKVGKYPLVNIKTKPANAEMIYYPMAGTDNEQVLLAVYDCKSNSKITIQTDIKIDQYLTNIAWSLDGEFVFVALLNRDQNELKLTKYNASTGEFVKTLFTESDEKYVQPLIPMIEIPVSNGDFLWRSEKNGFQTYYLYNNEGKELRAFQSEDKSMVFDDFIGFTSDNKSFLTYAYHNRGLDRDIFQVFINKGNVRKLSNGGVHSVLFNSKSDLILDKFSSLENPGQVDVIDVKSGKKLHTFHQAKNPFEDYKIGEVRLGTIKAADLKSDLNYRMILPHDFDSSQSYSILVYVYGGPGIQLINNSFMGGDPYWMHHQANKGYIVFSLDSRGSENRGKDFEQATFRNLGKIEVEDQIEGLGFLKTLPFANMYKIAVHGWSFGGFMTASLMLKSPDMFKVGVAGGPVTDWKYYEIMYTERYMDTPETNPEGYESSSLLNKVQNLKGNLMLIHGTSDDVVVVQHSHDFLSKCISEGVQVDYFPYIGHKHNVHGKDRVHLMEKVLSYIDEKLHH